MTHLHDVRPLAECDQTTTTIAFPPPAHPCDDGGPLSPKLFRCLDLEMERDTGTLWCSMSASDRPSYTPGLLADMASVQAGLRSIRRPATRGDVQSIRTLVVGSNTPGVYNLGGDLALFASAIRAQDRAALQYYAHRCVEIVFNNSDGYGGKITTVALVQGQALGGGFEAALACHVLIAERSARFGLPEVLFNLFPGMGAYSFLSRRLTPVAAERIILSGNIYTAAELHDMGLVDILAEDGEGVAATRRYILETERRGNARRAVQAMRDLVRPVTHQELIAITDVWVETALSLSEDDLRRMQRLVSAQSRRAAKRVTVAAE